MDAPAIETKDTKPAAENFSFFAPSSWISYAMAALTAGITSRFAIRRRFYTNTIDMIKQRGAELQQAERDGIAIAPTTIDEMTNEYLKYNTREYNVFNHHGTALAEKWGALNKNQEAAVDKFLENKGMDLLHRKYISLQPHQKTEVFFGAVTVFAVSVGAFLSTVKAINISHLFHLKEPHKQERGM